MGVFETQEQFIARRQVQRTQFPELQMNRNGDAAFRVEAFRLQRGRAPSSLAQAVNAVLDVHQRHQPPAS